MSFVQHGLRIAACAAWPNARSLVERRAAMSNVGFEEAARCASFSIIGDGAGNAVLQQKYPDPFFNF